MSFLTDAIEQDVYDAISPRINAPIKPIDFTKYLKNKAKFYQAFGNQLIITKENVEVEKSKSAKTTDFDHFRHALMRSFISNGYKFARFLTENGEEGFYNNVVTLEDFSFLDMEETPKKGMKLGKSFKFFMNDKDELDRWQVKYSQILNETKLKGNLHISIHPLDYLSMSENNNGWRSCQSLDGEFAAGTLSMMSDSCTVVAYLASPKQEAIRGMGDVEWNSKKWRQLVHIGPGLDKFFCSKHYPVRVPELEKEVVILLESTLNGTWGVEHFENPRNHMKNIIRRLYYNDVVSNPNSATLYVDFNKYDAATSRKMTVGTSVPCPQCGEHDIIDSNNFSCQNCGDALQCNDCNEWYHIDHTSWIDIGQFSVCQNCYEDSYISCERCDVTGHYDCGDLNYHEDEGWYCNDCWED